LEAFLTYVADESDVIVSIDGPWDEFARSNDSPECCSEFVLGRSVFEFIDSVEVIGIYRQLFSAARRTGRSVRFPFRCDAPRFRREMHMTLSPSPGDCIELRTRLIASSERPAQTLFDRSVLGEGDPIRVCSYCNRFSVPGQGWVEVEAAVESLQLFNVDRVPQISHGICDGCLIQQEALIEDLQRAT
jgi:hypothetical protein